MRKGHAKRILGAAIVSSVFAIAISPTIFADEITYTDSEGKKPTVDIDFNLEPSVLISIEGGDLIIPHLVPGHSEQSDPITITVLTNNPGGYTLSANAGTAANPSANLKHASVVTINPPDTEHAVTAEFTSLTDTVSELEGIGTNQWGFSIDNGATFKGLPGYEDTTGVQLAQTSSMAPSTPISFLIGANANADMTAGIYENVVNFIAVVNPVPDAAPSPEPSPEPSGS